MMVLCSFVYFKGRLYYRCILDSGYAWDRRQQQRRVCQYSSVLQRINNVSKVSQISLLINIQLSRLPLVVSASRRSRCQVTRNEARKRAILDAEQPQREKSTLSGVMNIILMLKRQKARLLVNRLGIQRDQFNMHNRVMTGLLENGIRFNSNNQFIHPVLYWCGVKNISLAHHLGNNLQFY